MLHSIEIDFTNSGSNVPAKEDQEQLAIHLSKKILEFLKAKISDHNSKEGANKTNIRLYYFTLSYVIFYDVTLSYIIIYCMV